VLRRLRLYVLLVACLVAITACGGSAGAISGVRGGKSEEEAEVPGEPIQDDRDSVLAEGVVEPDRWVDLRFLSGGTIIEVLVEEGDYVEDGQPLVRVDPTDALLAVRQAEAALSAAKARLALARAGARPEQIAVIEAQLAVAEATVAQAAGRRDEQAATSTEADVIAAQAEVLRANADYREAAEAHEDTLKCFEIGLYDGSEREICPALGPYEETARHAMDAAYAALQATQSQLDTVEEVAQAELGEAEAVLFAAIHQRDALKAELEWALSGSRSEEIAVAEAQVSKAEAALAQAQAMVEDTLIEAAFDGTVVEVTVNPGDQVLAGDVGVTVATLDRLQVVTTDLTEYDVVDVGVGQPAIVWLDADPGNVLNGHVTRIERQNTDRWGDVIYAVSIELDDAVPSSWRWGMTAQVEIARQGSNAALQASVPVASETAVAILREATVEPARWAALSLGVGGSVLDVPVEPDVRVQEGALLVKLNPLHARLAVEEAEAALASANASLALLQAGPHPDEVLAAEEKLAAAQTEIGQAAALRDKLTAGAIEVELAAARAQLAAAEFERQQAQLAWQQADKGDDEDKKALARDRLAAAELVVTAAEKRLAAQHAVSEARMSAANAGVWAAVARRDAAQAELDLLKAGTREEEISAAKAAVEQAEAALAAAQVALERTELRAPFDGVVTRVYVEVGDTVSPGQPLLVLADLDRLQVRTTDLTELDVAHIAEGDSVTVAVDALPGQMLMGRVSEIEFRGVDDRGDVVYPVVIELDETHPELLWGMTVLVEFEDGG